MNFAYLPSAVTASAIHTCHGNLPSALLPIGRVGAVMVVPGVYSGFKIFNLINRELLSKCIHILIAAMGVLIAVT